MNQPHQTTTEALEPHPSPDEIAGFAEGGLAPDELERVEAHLARCAPCREEVAMLTETEVAATPDPFRGPVPVAPAGTLARLRPLLLAACALLVASLTWRALAPDAPPAGFTASISGSAEALFGAVRSAEGPDFYVGVRAERAGELRLLALLDDGEVLAVPLDSAGSEALAIDAGGEVVLGPYPRTLPAEDGAAEDGAGERTTTHVLVIESHQPLPENWLRAGAVVADEASNALEAFVRSLRHEAGVGVRVLSLVD